MAKSFYPIFPQTLSLDTTSFTSSDGTNSKVIMTAGANGRRVDLLSITNSDTSAHDVAVYVEKSGGVGTLIGVVSVAAGAGGSSAAGAKNVLADTNLATLSDPNGNKYLYLEAGATLSMAFAVALASGKTSTVVGMSGDY